MYEVALVLSVTLSLVAQDGPSDGQLDGGNAITS